MLRQYFKYTLTRDSDNAEIIIDPRFSQDLAYVSKLEPEQAFRRTKLGGDITLVGNSYQFVHSQDIETEFIFRAYKKGKLKFTGRFFKTDCVFDRAEERAEVTPQAIDRYINILDKLDDEFSIEDLNPAARPVRSLRPGVFQIYDPDNGIISNHEGNIHWETPDVEVGYTVEEIEAFHFARNDFYLITQLGLTPDVTGLYLIDEPPAPGANDFSVTHVSKPYTIRRKQGPFGIEWDLINNDDNEVLFRATDFGTLVQAGFFDSDNPTDPNQRFTVSYRPVFVRLMTNAETVNGQETNLLAVDDIAPRNSYKRVIPIDTDNLIISTNIDTEPDVFGYVSSDQCGFNLSEENYFHKPENPGTEEQLYPVAPSGWDCFSLWFYYDDELRAMRLDAGTFDIIKKAYPLSELLKVLIPAIDSDLSYDGTPEYSEFLHGTNPIDGTDFEYFVIPTLTAFSNPDLPLNKVTVKLSEIIKTLYYVWRCKWYIDKDNRFRIEQLSYFDNGGDYYAKILSADISSLFEAQTNRPWYEFQQEIRYNKQDMPRQYVTKWREEQSQLFDGYPIEIVSRFVDKASNQEEVIPLFISDFNYFQISGVVEPKGFLLVATQPEEEYNQIAMLSIEVDNQIYDLQNGHLSNVYLHKTFHRYGLPAKNVRINKTESTAITVKRTMQNKLTFSIPNSINNNALGLIKTNLGEGQISELSEGVETDTKTVNIVFEPQ